MSYYTSQAREGEVLWNLDSGHGFIPRIGEENYKAVDRCVGPAALFSPDTGGLDRAASDV